jgi:hypothetical protein
MSFLVDQNGSGARSGNELLGSQTRLAQAFQMQLVHPLVAETLKLEECNRSVGLVLEESAISVVPRRCGQAGRGISCVGDPLRGSTKAA